MAVVTKPLMSKKTLSEFREFFVGWVLRQIETEFDAADIACDTAFTPSCSGARRSLVEQYYHTLDLTNWSDAQKLLRVFESVLASLEGEHDPHRWVDANAPKRISESLQKWLKRDGFVYRDGRLVALGDVAVTPKLSETARAFDAHYLHTQIERMQAAIESDPRLAIGTAKELVETTCKTILSERGKSFDPTMDVMDLVKQTRKELQLAPDDVPDSAKAADTIRRLLSNLTTVVQCLSELRNPYGTGHGPHGKAKGLQPRHARLAVGAAASLAMFLFETHSERGAKPPVEAR